MWQVLFFKSLKYLYIYNGESFVSKCLRFVKFAGLLNVDPQCKILSKSPTGVQVKADRLIAIGDIHGELTRLEKLLSRVSPSSNDQFVFLGDYIDRGKDSSGVIARLIKFGKKYPQTIFLRGNHEQMLLEARAEMGADAFAASSSGQFMRLYSAALSLSLANGGVDTLNSYGVTDFASLPESHVKFIKATILWWRYEQFLFVHAGAEANMPLEEQDPATLLMRRHSPPGGNGEIHVVGHTPTGDGLPRFEPGRIWLDTGAAYGFNLTACNVMTQTVWQA
jgi:serine/threonine protein phosphatase 1